MTERVDPRTIASRFRTNMFIGIGFAEAITLCAVIFVFIEGSLWIYAFSLPFTLLGMWLIAPSRANLDRIDEALRSAGSPISIRQALDHQ